MMTAIDRVSAYIEKHEKWKEELTILRSIFNDSELEEDVKWGAPAYLLNGKLVAGLGAFKNHMGIWFHQGVFLKDVQQQLQNAQEGKTKALRQWRFEKGDPINKELVASYVQEAIENSLAGKEVKPRRTTQKDINVPPLLAETFTKNKSLHKAFEALTPGKQREYCNHISEAKREATKLSRLEKILPMIQEGKGLHDKYKNC